MGSRWTVRSALQRAFQVLKEEGPVSLWFRVLGETVYRRVVVVERWLDEPVRDVAPGLLVTFSLLREEEIEEYATFRPEADPSEVRRRLRAGYLCFVGRYEGRMVHTCWVATGRVRIDYLDRECVLAPGEAYVYESFTAPDFRGRNVATARTAYMQRMLREAGYRRLLAVVVPENRVAFGPVEKGGYHRVGKMGYVRLGPWRCDFGRLGRPGSEPAQWDDAARSLEEKPHYLDPFLGELKRQAHLRLVERWGGAPVDGRVLKTDLFEEALGPDAFLADLSGWLVAGIDVSLVIAERARRRDAGGRGVYVAADVRRPPFADGSFALIISPSTLDHFADPGDLGRSLRELARLLEPTGRLIVTLDNRQNVFDPLLRLAHRLRLVPYYLGRSYTVAELRAELEAAGLVVRETTAILHNPRLVATAAVAMANRLGWPPLIRAVQRILVTTQRLEDTRWRYLTGSFVAAWASKRGA